jgi:alpha-ketoglutarate-dependent taurine dioxygenase
MERVRRRFDLSRGPLIRASCLRLGAEAHVLLVVMHHIVCDGWSMGVIVRELAALYESAADGRPSPLPELELQYADYAYWQREWLRGENLERLLAYWRQRLAGAPPLLELPSDRPRPPVQSFRGARHTFALPPDLCRLLAGLSRREGVTLFMTLLAAFQTLLYRYSRQEDVVVGADINTRSRAETEKMIGYFINMLVMRTSLRGNPTFRELLGRVREVALGAYAHQDLPFERIVEELQPERSLGHSPVFQVVLNYDSVAAESATLPGLTLTPQPLELERVKFDLSLFMWESAGELTGAWMYSLDLFDPGRIERLHRHFETLLRDAVARPDARVDALELLTGAEKEASAAAAREVKKANLQRFKSARPRAVTRSPEALVEACELTPGRRLPLLVRPAAEDVDLAAWAAGNRGFIEERLLTHGAILFRGFGGGELSDFRRFTDALSPELLDYTEPSSPRSEVEDKIYTSTEYPAEQWIQLHNEMSYAHNWPRRVYFFCQRPAAGGGETPVAYSREVYELLDPRLRERFRRLGVMYVRNYGDGLDLPWRHVFGTSERAEVERYCRAAGVEFEWKQGDRLTTRQVRQAVIVHPTTGETVWFNQAHAFHSSTLGAAVREALRAEMPEEEFPRNAYYGDGSPIGDSAVEEIREAYRRASVAFPWQPGDVLAVENMLVAHGRAPFNGPRRVLVAMSGRVTNEEVETFMRPA